MLKGFKELLCFILEINILGDMEENELWCINWMLEIEFEVLFGWYECVPKEICTLFWASFFCFTTADDDPLWVFP